ncbi:uncharacterized protein LOC110858472 isoform X1 [Folsomia candida]|uniref:uncharacterized protein LOC110858472 isoform X1 n=1 Tax=Folsomia candida TaxID=158441 RepID=UPI001604B701|nr:uncharacterized protein LOC110858472 isoform X1 [Folsomia candida]
MQARKQEALEISYGYYSNQYQGQKMYYINSERELANLSQNTDADLMKMLYKAVRGDPIFCSCIDCKCEAYFHYDLEKVTKVDFQLAAGQVSKSPPPPLPRQRPRPCNPSAIQAEVDRLFRTLKKEMGLVLAIPFNVYSVLLVKKADFPGLSDPRAVINALLGTTREIVAWLYTGKGVEAENGGIHEHHFYGSSTIQNELVDGDKIAIQIARMMCNSQKDAEEKEAFVLYASQLAARKKSDGGVRIVPINVRMEWVAWRRLPYDTRKLSQECGDKGVKPYSFTSKDDKPIFEEDREQKSY